MMDFATLIITFLIFWYAALVGSVLVVTGIHDKDKVKIIGGVVFLLVSISGIAYLGVTW